MGKIFSDLVYGNYLPQAIPLPESIGKAGLMTQDRADKVEAGIDSTKDELLKVMSKEQDTALRNKRLGDYENTMNDLIENGDGRYSQLGNQVKHIARKIHEDMTRGELAAIQANYNADLAYKKELNDFKDASPETKLALYNIANEEYKGIGTQNALGNYNSFKGRSPAKEIDLTELADKAIDGIAEMEAGTKNVTWGKNADGTIDLKKTDGTHIKTITAQRVRDAVEAKLRSNQEVAPYLKQSLLVHTYGTQLQGNEDYANAFVGKKLEDAVQYGIAKKAHTSYVTEHDEDYDAKWLAGYKAKKEQELKGNITTANSTVSDYDIDIKTIKENYDKNKDELDNINSQLKPLENRWSFHNEKGEQTLLPNTPQDIRIKMQQLYDNKNQLEDLVTSGKGTLDSIYTKTPLDVNKELNNLDAKTLNLVKREDVLSGKTIKYNPEEIKKIIKYGLDNNLTEEKFKSYVQKQGYSLTEYNEATGIPNDDSPLIKSFNNLVTKRDKLSESATGFYKDNIMMVGSDETKLADFSKGVQKLVSTQPTSFVSEGGLLGTHAKIIDKFQEGEGEKVSTIPLGNYINGKPGFQITHLDKDGKAKSVRGNINGISSDQYDVLGRELIKIGNRDGIKTHSDLGYSLIGESVTNGKVSNARLEVLPEGKSTTIRLPQGELKVKKVEGTFEVTLNDKPLAIDSDTKRPIPYLNTQGITRILGKTFYTDK